MGAERRMARLNRGGDIGGVLWNARTSGRASRTNRTKECRTETSTTGADAEYAYSISTRRTKKGGPRGPPISLRVDVFDNWLRLPRAASAHRPTYIFRQRRTRRARQSAEAGAADLLHEVARHVLGFLQEHKPVAVQVHLEHVAAANLLGRDEVRQG